MCYRGIVRRSDRAGDRRGIARITIVVVDIPCIGQFGLKIACALIDLIRKPESPGDTRFWQDFLNDADGLALHRLQVVLFNFLVLFVVWRDMIQLGTVAQIDKGWAALLGASALTFVFGKSAESTTPLMPSTPAALGGPTAEMPH